MYQVNLDKKYYLDSLYLTKWKSRFYSKARYSKIAKVRYEKGTYLYVTCWNECNSLET